MSLQEFLKASIGRKAPNMVPVSHPERGFDIINKKNLDLWKQWGWQEESWGVIASEPAGAKKVTEPKAKRVKKEKVEATEPETEV